MFNDCLRWYPPFCRFNQGLTSHQRVQPFAAFFLINQRSMNKRATPSSVEEWLKFAVQKLSHGAPQLALIQGISDIAPANAEFWEEFAGAAYNGGYRLASLNAWERASELTVDDDRSALLERKAAFYIAAFEKTGESLYRDEAFASLEAGGHFEKLARCLLNCGSSGVTIAQQIERALQEKGSLDEAIELGPFQDVKDWSTLGAYYMSASEFGCAMNAYHHAFANGGDIDTQLQEVTHMLLSVAIDRRIKIDPELLNLLIDSSGEA